MARDLPLVCTLLRLRRPPAVPRLVVAVVVDAVNRMRRRRLWPHVLDEQIKARSSGFSEAPAVAHSNPSVAIPNRPRAARIIAALENVVVSPHKGVRRVARDKSMDGRALATESPAGLHSAISKSVAGDDAAIATVASALPCDLARLSSGLLDDDESCEALAGQIASRRHVTSIDASGAFR